MLNNSNNKLLIRNKALIKILNFRNSRLKTSLKITIINLTKIIINKIHQIKFLWETRHNNNINSSKEYNTSKDIRYINLLILYNEKRESCF